MKFRKLNKEELEEVRTEFIRFLVTNGITADEWEKMKDETPEKAERVIELFSDLVFEKVLKDIEYLEFKTPNDIKTFHCTEDKIYMLGLRAKGAEALDFTQNQSPEQMMQLIRLSGVRLQLYSGEKAYRKARELELFEMMENGARISRDGALYQTLSNLK